MAGARHVLLALLAVIGIISGMPLANGSAACPLDTATSMSMMHHGHRGQGAPVARDACAACLAVLPSLQLIEGRLLRPVALSCCHIHQLFGITPELDPPPPRAA